MQEMCQTSDDSIFADGRDVTGTIFLRLLVALIMVSCIKLD